MNARLPISPTYSYSDVLSISERVCWTIDDVLPAEDVFDFDQDFLPESLARTHALTFLSLSERRTLNQIRANAYLCIFGLVEEFILPFVMDHARPLLSGDDHRVRALLSFASEEAKHIHLFKTFRERFEEGFGVGCQVIGPAPDIARAVLAHHPLGVALAILHIEWMTQRHYVESARGNSRLDRRFKSLLRHHWMEEAQHAKLDTLMVETLADSCSEKEIELAFQDYLAIGGLIDGGLEQQVHFDLQALTKKTGRRLSDSEYEKAYQVQRSANRWTYLGSGMTHPDVLATLDGIAPECRARLEEVARLFM